MKDDHENLSAFSFTEERGSGAIRTQAFSVEEKYPMLYSIQS